RRTSCRRCANSCTTCVASLTRRPEPQRHSSPDIRQPKETSMSLDNVLYTAHATATGGRDGGAKSDDGRLDVKLSVPKSMGGDDAPRTNPEQMSAAGYSACFLGAMKFIAGTQKLTLPRDTRIDGSVGIGPIPAGFGIEVELAVHLPGMEQAAAEALVARAHE